MLFALHVLTPCVDPDCSWLHSVFNSVYRGNGGFSRFLVLCAEFGYIVYLCQSISVLCVCVWRGCASYLVSIFKGLP